ncbi:MAG: type III-B CRISPR module RAMP protein Cmr4, partial [Bacteroidota bacterium]
MRTTDTYLIRAISNLHPGSGQADFGIIDKHVQRDPVTNLPIIFASSIKGAMRELFHTHPKVTGGEELTIFGSDVAGKLATKEATTTSKKAKALIQGSYRFLDAHLLSLPIRSSKYFYFPAICPEIIVDFLQHLQDVGHPQAQAWQQRLGSLDSVTTAYYYTGDSADNQPIRMEDIRVTPLTGTIEQPVINALCELLRVHRIAIITAADFRQLADNLPTVARNYLNDGISDNLWYEEMVPRESRFY